MREKTNRSKTGIIVGIIVFILLVGGVFMWKIVGNEEGNHFQVRYSENLYCKTVDPNKVSRIPDKSIEYVEDELIIDAVSGMTYEDVEKLVKKYESDIVGYIGTTNTYQIEMRDDITYDELLELKKTLEAEDAIAGVYLNKIYPVENSHGYYPNDPEWKDEWSDPADGENWALEFMEVPEAWYYMQHISEHMPQEVRIGIFEVNGVDYEHEDLKDNFVEEPLCNLENEEHGTAVAGIIGAGFDNGIGMSGVVPNVKLRAASWNGIANHGKLASMACRLALVYLITADNEEQQTTIINVSLGAEDVILFAASRRNEEALETLAELNKELEEFLCILLDNGYDFLICKGAGNNNATSEKDKRYVYIRADEDDENATCGYVRASSKAAERYKKSDDYESRLDYGNVDAQYDVFSGITNSRIKDRVVVVGSVRQVSSPQAYGFGASEYSCAGSRVDVLTPGENIYVLRPGNKYAVKGVWGTSYSAPYASGVAGLMLSVNPELTGKELKELMLKSATGEYVGVLNEQPYKYQTVDANLAVRYADAYTPDCMYTWVVDPDIEADNIYYLNSDDAWEFPINVLNKQMENSYEYAVIKKDGKYGLIDMNGALLDGMNFQFVSTHLSRYHVTYSEPHYDSMTGTETTEFDLTNKGLTYAFGHGDASFLYGGFYFWNDGLSQYYLANEMPEPDTTIAVREISEAFVDDNVEHKVRVKEQELIEQCKNASGKYAIYTDGKLVTDFVYDECGSYAEGLMAVCRNGKWGYVNKNGEIIIPIEYDASWKEYIPYENCKSLETSDFCYAASDGYVVLCKNGKWELRSVQGEMVIQPEVFEEIRPVYNGKCWVKRNGKWGVIEIQHNAENINLTSDSAADQMKDNQLESILIGTWIYNLPNSNARFVLKFSEDGTADYSGDASDAIHDAAYHLEEDKVYIDIGANTTFCLNVAYEMHNDTPVLSVSFDEEGSDPELDWLKQHIEGDYEKYITKITTETYQKVYGPILKEVCYKYGENNIYYFYDIDKDGIKELIVQERTCYQDYMYQFYTIKNNESVYLGEVSGFHCAFYEDESGGAEPYIIRSEGFQQQSVVSHIKIENDKIVEERISSGYANTYYSNPYELGSIDVSLDAALQAEWYDE